MSLRALPTGDTTPPSLTDEAFKDLIDSDEIFQYTEAAIANQICRSDFKMPGLLNNLVTGPKRKRQLSDVPVPQFGYCHTMKLKESEEPLLVVSKDFPIYVRGQPDIKRASDADKVAAVYARSLDVFHGAFEYALKRNLSPRAISDGYRAADWNKYFNPRRALPYRAAGLIALTVVGLDEIQNEGVAILPPQISGLKNPFIQSPIGGLRVFSNVLNDFSKKHSS